MLFWGDLGCCGGVLLVTVVDDCLFGLCSSCGCDFPLLLLSFVVVCCFSVFFLVFCCFFLGVVDVVCFLFVCLMSVVTSIVSCCFIVPFPPRRVIYFL